MIERQRLTLVVALIAALAILLYIMLELGTGGGITVEDPYFTVTPDGGGVFMIIRNGLDKEVCLVGARLPDYPDAVVTLHETVSSGGVEMMRPVDRICASPGGEIRLERGGYHIMFKGARLADTDRLRVVLIFDDGSEVEVEAVKRLTV